MSRDLTRRSLLRSAGAISGTGLVTGTALGSEGTGPEAAIVGTSSEAAVEAAKSKADSVVRVLDFADLGQAVSGRFPSAAIEGLRKRPDVRYVEPEGTVEPLGQTVPWGVDRIDADAAHADGETGSGADVAIIDSGIDADHPDLEANLGEGYAVVSCSECSEPWGDDHGHGTHCAGIADAVDNDTGVVGVSTDATLHAVKVFDADSSATVSGLAEGIQWVADQGYDVGSMSLGSTDSYQTLRDACQYATDKGVLLVAAAGNDGSCSDCVRYPAAYSSVVAVSATTSDDELADFSSTGPEIEFAAPGYGIYSTVPGDYDYMSGTSMACPHVAGAAGQLMADGRTNEDARARLRETAEDIGLSESEQGYGLVDVAAAVDDGSDDTPPSVATDGASDVGETSATLNGLLEDTGGSDSVEVALKYRQAGSQDLSDYVTVTRQILDSTGSFSGTATELEPDTEYEFHAVANGSNGESEVTPDETFATNADTAPVVATDGASDVGETSATLNGLLEDTGGSDSVEVALKYRPSGSQDLSDYVTVTRETLSAPGSFSGTATGLDPDTEYEFHAVANGSNGESDVTPDETFATNADSESAPSLDAYAVSEAGAPNPHVEITADWSVSDADGDLDSVLVEVFESGRRVDAARTSVDGTSASGTDQFEIKHAGSSTFEVILTVTDAAGNETTTSEEVTS